MTKVPSFKRLASATMAVIGLICQRADAAPLEAGLIVGKLTAVSVVDEALEVNGSTVAYLELRFANSGTICETNLAAGDIAVVRKDTSPNVFEHFVKTAEAAFLAGRTVRFATGKRVSTSPCLPYYILIE